MIIAIVFLKDHTALLLPGTPAQHTAPFILGPIGLAYSLILLSYLPSIFHELGMCHSWDAVKCGNEKTDRI